MTCIPEFYILKRWTKEAKNGFVLDECLRYSELHCDALRYAREGSTSGEVLTFAQETLQVAFSEVVLMKQQIVSLQNVMNMVLQTTVRNFFFHIIVELKIALQCPVCLCCVHSCFMYYICVYCWIYYRLSPYNI